jgi:adenosylcobinamide-GDP ribazoletransferase
MRKILLAFQFLTILPIKTGSEISEEDVGRASALFPVVALFEGSLLTVTAFLLHRVFSLEVTNGLLILLIVALNGGLHLDGLSDTFDAIASRTSRERKLAIMKDSTVGPLGVIAIIMVILLKFFALNALASRSVSFFYYVLFLMPLFSRWGMVSAAFHGRPVRNDGLGNIFIKYTGLKELIMAVLLTPLIALSAFYILKTGPATVESHLLFILFYLIFFYVLSLLLVWFFNRNFGGMTGDTLGAVNEVGAVVFLLMASTTGGSRLFNGL